MSTLEAVRRGIVGCSRCPRLVASREDAARHPPARFASRDYWARPVPGFGDPGARIYVLGLAPAAHGGNRTGRSFTGNPSADWLTPALHTVGLANQATSEHAGDGLRLQGAWTGSAVRCAPPGNRPTAQERDTCMPHLAAEIYALPDLRVIVALGGFAWSAALGLLDDPPRPRFAHGAEHRLPGGLTLLASYHPSRQNTATGLLRPGMLEDVLRRAIALSAR